MVEQEGFCLYERFIPQICGGKWMYRTKTSTIVCVGEGTVDFEVVEGETCFSHVEYLDCPENESIYGNDCALLDDNFQMQSHCLGFERMYMGFHPQQIQQHSCSAKRPRLLEYVCCSPSQKSAPITLTS